MHRELFLQPVKRQARVEVRNDDAREQFRARIALRQRGRLERRAGYRRDAVLDQGISRAHVLDYRHLGRGVLERARDGLADHRHPIVLRQLLFRHRMHDALDRQIAGQRWSALAAALAPVPLHGNR